MGELRNRRLCIFRLKLELGVDPYSWPNNNYGSSSQAKNLCWKALVGGFVPGQACSKEGRTAAGQGKALAGKAQVSAGSHPLAWFGGYLPRRPDGGPRSQWHQGKRATFCWYMQHHIFRLSFIVLLPHACSNFRDPT